MTDRSADPASAAEPVTGELHPFPAGLIKGFDLAATILFALEGSLLGAAADLDLLGIVVAGFVTALGGGVIRDLLLGDSPPAALRYSSYVVSAIIGGSLVAVFAPQAGDIPFDLLVVLDAAGISAFAVSGAAKTLDFRLNAMTAVLIGVITAVGGGMIRDLLLNRIPVILTADFYATAALLGAIVMVVGVRLQRPGQPVWQMMVVGATVCFTLRLLGYFDGWELPHP